MVQDVLTGDEESLSGSLSALRVFMWGNVTPPLDVKVPPMGGCNHLTAQDPLLVAGRGGYTELNLLQYIKI